MAKEIYILHEYGANSHYIALNYLIESEKHDYKLKYIEFSIIKKIIKSVLTREYKLFFKQIKNIACLFSFLFLKKQKILLGVAPYDYRLIFLMFILRRHDVYYHSSWPYWDKSLYPKKIMAKSFFVQRVWRYFLESRVIHIFSVTETAKHSLINNYNIEEDNISVVYHSYDPSIYFEKEDSIHESKIRLLFVGRLEKSKGLFLIKKLIENLDKEKYLFSFVGDGSLKAFVETLVEKNENVYYLGYIKDQFALAEVFRSHDLLLLPSIRQKNWEELFGMVVIEAMACGVVPVTTNHVGPKEILKDFPCLFFKESEYVKNIVERIDGIHQLQEAMVEKAKFYRKDNVKILWRKIVE